MASRVRSLDVDIPRDFNGSFLSPDVAFKLLYRLKSSPQFHLLPGLTSVTWRIQSSEEIGSFLAFIPSTLKSLDLGVHLRNSDQAQQAHSFIRNIGRMSPLLQHLRLSVNRSVVGTGASLLKGLGDLDSLSRLELPDVQATDELLRLLAYHPDLVTLELQHGALTEDGLRDFMEKLASSCPHLRTLTLHLPSIFPEPNSTKLRFELLLPLFRCPALRHLKVYHPRFISVGQPTLPDIATSWPDLKSLNLCAGITLPCPTENRLYALKLYAEYFGETLEELGQQFNCRTIPEATSAGARFHKLRVLDMGKSHVDEANAIPIAEYLGAVCPAGVQILVEARPSVPNHWPMVQNMVGMVHRAQEIGYRRRLEEEAQG